MKALVTGVTGFTGGHLARRLRHTHGDHVRVLVRNETQADVLRQEGFEIAIGDLTNEASLQAACAGMDVVYNIAALYRTAGLPSSTYRAVNARGVAAIVRAAAAAGARRVVHCSTVGEMIGTFMVTVAGL